MLVASPTINNISNDPWPTRKRAEWSQHSRFSSDVRGGRAPRGSRVFVSCETDLSQPDLPVLGAWMLKADCEAIVRIIRESKRFYGSVRAQGKQSTFGRAAQ